MVNGRVLTGLFVLNACAPAIRLSPANPPGLAAPTWAVDLDPTTPVEVKRGLAAAFAEAGIAVRWAEGCSGDEVALDVAQVQVVVEPSGTSLSWSWSARACDDSWSDFPSSVSYQQLGASSVVELASVLTELSLDRYGATSPDVSAVLYGGPLSPLRAATRAVLAGRPDQGSREWRVFLQGSSPQVASRAAYNLSVLAGLQGRPTVARQWAAEALRLDESPAARIRQHARSLGVLDLPQVGAVEQDGGALDRQPAQVPGTSGS